MTCDLCDTSANELTTVSLITGKRGRPPVKQYCPSCLSTELAAGRCKPQMPAKAPVSSSPALNGNGQVKSPPKRQRGIRKPKPLTEAERRLLQYPPNEDTWICKTIYQGGGGENVQCDTLNAGYEHSCVMCRKPQPENAPLLMPLYEAARKRVEEIENYGH